MTDSTSREAPETQVSGASRICPECKQEFVPTHGKTRQRFCSKKCYMIDYERGKTERRRAAAAPKEVLPEGQKRCGGCGKVKSLEDFAKRTASPDGRQHRCRVCQQEWQHENPEKRRDTWRRYRRDNYMLQKYNLTFEQYWVIFDLQDGRCAICRRTAEEAGMKHSVQQLPLHVDHCHDSNEVRGLLCRFCNQGLGSFEDDVERLRRAVTYLELDRALTVTG